MADQKNESEPPVVVDGAADAPSAAQAAYGATSYGGMVTPPGSPEKHVSYLGTTSHDAEFTKNVNRVITLCLIATVVKIANVVLVQLTPGVTSLERINQIVGLCIFLTFPLCGYVGAKSEAKGWMCCFCGWNWVITAYVVYQLAQGSAQLASVDHSYFSASHKVFIAFFYILGVAAVAIHGLSAFYGLKLYRKLSKAQIVINNPVFVTNQTVAQPGAQPLVAGMNV